MLVKSWLTSFRSIVRVSHFGLMFRYPLFFIHTVMCWRHSLVQVPLVLHLSIFVHLFLPFIALKQPPFVSLVPAMFVHDTSCCGAASFPSESLITDHAVLARCYTRHLAARTSPQSPVFVELDHLRHSHRRFTDCCNRDRFRR